MSTAVESHKCQRMFEKGCLIKVLNILSNLPLSSVSLSELILNEQCAECNKCISSILILLQSFGILQFNSDSILLKSTTSSLFIKSLKEYVENDLTILTGWEEHKGRPEKTNEGNLLTALNFLYTMEKKRLQLLGTAAKEIKINNIVRVIIKAKINGKEKYLMQYDVIAKQYQLIGGYVDITDKNTLAAITREITEELPELELEVGEDLHLQEYYKSEQFEKLISNTYGVLSGYEITVFLAYNLDASLISKIDNKNNSWISLGEILNKKARDGKRIITISREMIDAIETCKPSFNASKFLWSDIFNDRRIQIAASIATIIGVVFTALTFFLH